MSDLGNKQVMADNIKRLMKEFNVSQSDICTRLSLKPSTFSDWVNAKTYPRIDKIEMLANYFGVEKSDLIENKTVKASSTVTVYNAVNISQRMNETECQLMLDYWDLDDHGKKAIHTIMNLEHERCTKESNLRNDLTILKPCYECGLSAGTGLFVFDDLPIDQIEVPADYDYIDFVIGVNGDSMEPTYLNGDKVMVVKQSSIHTGEIGAFMVNGEAYIKELGENCLISHNKKYLPMKFEEGMRIDCIGRVVGKL